MIAHTLINPIIPTLKSSDSINMALEWMEDFGTTQLVVVDDHVYQGIVSEPILQDAPNGSLPISSMVLQHHDVFAAEDQHVYELINVLHEFGLSVIPVLAYDRSFMGCISRDDLIERFVGLLGVKEKGAIIVLKISELDYSLAEISRLIESNGTKILSSIYNTGDPLNPSPQLTLKLNKREINPLIATLERFGYEIIEAHANDPIKNMDQERLDMLMRYLAT
ncbi:CBS domain-containing protein [Dyadobacter jejuensis]|uniref:CBS domain-containing protein n=1 Tax=Dyadobacter jejuensis TaxID=1082580 RepID=A0A316A6X2_9BACT|nr:CBS domain-containing protein [Dyadobacter jejuensis]PWJ53222.1 CBS domain-containing protein [Dyadobacter jejuensis]